MPEEPGLADRPQQWKVHAVEDVWDGAAPFSVRRDLVSTPDLPDEQFGRLVLQHPGAVVILAALEELGYVRRRLRGMTAGWLAALHHRQNTRLSRDELAFLLEQLVSH